MAAVGEDYADLLPVKRMTAYVIIITGGLCLCGLLAVRRAIKTAPDFPAPARGARPTDEWEAIATPRSYAVDLAARKRGFERLQREEARQRPQEGRN